MTVTSTGENTKMDSWRKFKRQDPAVRCAVKFGQAISGASLADMVAKRNQNPE
ncbi:hypothetical protein A6R68_23913, partial [Neotoma lepida]